LAQDGWNCRFSIADFRLLMDIGRSCPTTFSIVNRQSAIGNETLVFSSAKKLVGLANPLRVG
jgi:hypothetical protein